MNIHVKRKDGFLGERLINVPGKIIINAQKKYPALLDIYVTEIGYFPSAAFHYRERLSGCRDDIFIYCLRGKGYVIIGNKHFKVVANQYLIIPATDCFIRYWSDQEDPWTIYWMHFTGTLIEAFNNSLGLTILRGPINNAFNERGLGLWEEIYTTFETGHGFETLLRASLLIRPFIGSFLFQNVLKPASIGEFETKINDYMLKNLHKKLTVEILARQFSLSVSYFSKYFKNINGMPPIDYFIDLKMKKAQAVLKDKDIKIKLLAAELGYDDAYHFSRLFKRYCGLSPSRYRSSIAK